MVQSLRRADVDLLLEKHLDLSRRDVDQVPAPELRSDEMLSDRSDGAVVASRLRQIRVDPPAEELVDGPAAVFRRGLLDSEADAFLPTLQLAPQASRLRLRLGIAGLLSPASVRVLVPDIPTVILTERLGHDFLTLRRWSALKICHRSPSAVLSEGHYASGRRELRRAPTPESSAGSNLRSPPTRTQGSCPASARW